MKFIYFVSITICASLSIDLARSQHQNLNGFPQPKAIRDNGGYFRHEIFYPGSSGNTIPNQPNLIIHKPILPPTIQSNAIPAPLPALINHQPIIATIPEQPEIDPTLVRSVLNRQAAVIVPPTVPTTPRPATTTEPATPEELEQQAKSAYYEFGASVHDTINDHMHVRQETREGLTLKGMYSYSDGFFQRTVHYEADEDGYRVTKEEVQPIGNGEGPKFNPKGNADVKSTLAGDYSITVDDFKLNQKQEAALGLDPRLSPKRTE